MVELTTHRPIVTWEELAGRLPSRTPDWVMNGIFSVSGMAELNRAHAVLGRTNQSHQNLFDAALAELRLGVTADDRELDRIPSTGAVIVVANHPFGGADGLAMGATLLRRRSDVRLMANAELARVAKLAPWLLDVNVFDAKRHTTANARQVRAALRHLAAGGLLVIFPAGRVSHFQPHRGEIADDEWSSAVGLLARRTGATVVPCFFEGANSALFQAAGLVHPALSTALLPRELLARKGSKVRLRVGRPLGASTIRRFATNETLTAWLRLRTYDLAKTAVPLPLSPVAKPLAPAIPPTSVARELSELPSAQELIAQGQYRVYLAKQSAIPRTLEELGRLRELTFRAAGEGTGETRDLDAFDSTYHHLVLYDAEQGLLVGAYRLAFCDQTIKRQGTAGLYTQTLFRFRSPMSQELAEAIELGRSFVRPEYQRKPLALAMLWRGIGEVLARNPKYRRLVGAVSISDRYRGSSRRLLLAFLEEMQSDPSLRRFVEPRRPVRFSLSDIERKILASSCRTVRDLSQLIAELSEAGERMPVLLERYLELGARVLALSTDPSFGNCVDALVVVDLDRAPIALLRRFLGDRGYAAFHASPTNAPISDAAGPSGRESPNRNQLVASGRWG